MAIDVTKRRQPTREPTSPPAEILPPAHPALPPRPITATPLSPPPPSTNDAPSFKIYAAFSYISASGSIGHQGIILTLPSPALDTEQSIQDAQEAIKQVTNSAFVVILNYWRLK